MAISVITRLNGEDTSGAAGQVQGAFTSNAVHNQIIVIAAVLSSTTTATIADTAGNTYRLVADIQGTAFSASMSQRCWVAEDCLASAGTNTVTVTIPGSNPTAAFFYEVNGLATLRPFDKTATAKQSSSTTPTSATTATTSFANELVLGVTHDNGSTTGVLTAGAGYSNAQVPTPANGLTTASEEKIVSATGTQSASFGLTATNGTELTSVFTFADTTVVALPTVTTQAETSIGKTSGTGNGNITDTGGANATARGVVYDTVSRALPGNVAPASSGYVSNVSASGSFGTGAFTSSMTSLAKNTTFFVRAFAQNSAGYSYGSEVSFAVTTSTPLLDRVSSTDIGFKDEITGLAEDKLMLEDGTSALLLENGSKIVLNYNYPSGNYVSYTVPAAQTLAPGTYYWRVRERGVNGSYGAWGEVRTLTIASGTFTRTHTTDINKKKAANLKTHTTDVYKRTARFHTTDIFKRISATRTHTTDVHVRMRPVAELVDDFNDNSLDVAKWSGTSVSESSQQLNMVGAVSGAMNSVKRYNFIGSGSFVQLVQWAGNGNAYVIYIGNSAVTQFVCWYLTGTTVTCYMYNGAFNTQGTALTYNSAVHKYFRIRESAGTVYWDYSTDGIAWTNQATMATTSVPFDTNNVMQSFSSNGQTSGTSTWDNFNVSPSITRSHTTDINKRKATVKTHTTDVNKRKATTRTHSTDVNKRIVSTRTFTTDVLKRKATTQTHTTDVNKRAALTRVHSTDVNKRKTTLKTHTTDTLKRLSTVRTHTTDVNKRQAITRTHTTDVSSLLARRINLVTNPNFESDILTAVPANWTSYGGGWTTLGVANDFSSGGTKSFKISSSSTMDGGIWLVVNDLPMGASVTLSAWVKSDATVSNASLVLNTGQHGLTGSITVNANQGANANGRYSATIPVLDQPGVCIFLGQGSFGSASQGTVWFDDVQLEVTSAVLPNQNASSYPVAQVATTVQGKFVDGTSGGSTVDPGYGGFLFGNGGTASALIDSSEYHLSPASYKISTTSTGSFVEARLGGVNAYWGKYGALIRPGYSYNFTFWMKTNYISGDSADGAYLDLIVSDTTGAAVGQEISTTRVKTTTGWTQYSASFTAHRNAAWIHPEMRIYGHTGTATLIMDAWFDELNLQQTSPLPMNYFDGNSTGAGWRGTTNLSQSYTNIFQIWKTHTTDVNKRLGAILRTHTTDVFKRLATTKTHTTDVNKRKATLVTHTTDVLKRSVTAKTHSTDINKRLSGVLRTHSTDVNKKKSGVLRTHTTDINKRAAGLLRSHTTDVNKRLAGIVRSHTTDVLKRVATVKTHTTDLLKRLSTTKTHTTDVNKRLAAVRSHTTDVNKKKAGATKVHSTDVNKRLPTVKSHTTDINKRKASILLTHTTDTLKRQLNVKTHTTDLLKRLATVKAHTTDVNKRLVTTKAHSTDINKRKATVRVHTTDINKRSTTSRSHSTDVAMLFARRLNFITNPQFDNSIQDWSTSGAVVDNTYGTVINPNSLKFTTIGNWDNFHLNTTIPVKAGDVLTASIYVTTLAAHTVNGGGSGNTTAIIYCYWQGSGVSPSEQVWTGSTVDLATIRTGYRMVGTLTAPANAIAATFYVYQYGIGVGYYNAPMLERNGSATPYFDGDSINAGWRGTTDYSTSYSLSDVYTRTHSTDSALRLGGQRYHTTDTLKRAIATKSHATDVLKRSIVAKTHTTDVLKRKLTIRTHSTDINKRLANVARLHTTDTLKRSTNSRTHSTDVLKRLSVTKTHTTDTYTHRQLALTHTTDTLKRKATLRTHTTDLNKRKATLRTHTTDVLKRLAILRTHSTDVNKTKAGITRSHTTDTLLRKANTRAHSTDINKRKSNVLTHLTDILKRKATIAVHTTDVNKRKSAITRAHSTDVNKRKASIVLSHTTSTFLRAARAVSHTTDVLKRKATTVFQSTDVFKRGSNNPTHTTDVNKRKATTRTHSTDILKRTSVVKSHTTDILKRKATVATHTTDINKRALYARAHTTDVLKRKATTKSHTTDINKRLSGNAHVHTTDINKRKATVRTHTTDVLKRKANIVSHSTDLLKRKQNTRTHSTDIAVLYARRRNLVTNPSFELGQTGWVEYHNPGPNATTVSIDATTSWDGSQSLKLITGASGNSYAGSNYLVNNLESGKTYTVSYMVKGAVGGENFNTYVGVATNPQSNFTLTTGWVRYSQTFVASSGAANVYVRSQTPSATFWVDAVMVEEGSIATPYFDGDYTNAAWRGTPDASQSYSTSSVYFPAHTTDVLKRTKNTVSHTTDVSKRKAGITKTHSTDVNKRKSLVVAHSTDINKRKANVRTHSTDVNKTIKNLRSHSTDVLKRKSVALSHATDVLKRKASILSHTTDILKRKLNTKSHSTDILKRKANVVAHSTDINKRKARTLSHSTDTNLRKVTVVAHTTDTNLRAIRATSHSTDTNKRRSPLVTHSTDVFKRAKHTLHHTTSVNVSGARIRRHSTDIHLDDGSGQKRVLSGGVFVHAPVFYLKSGQWERGYVMILVGGVWVKTPKAP